MEIEFYLVNSSISILLIIGGLLVQIYLKRNGLWDLSKILGVNIYWIKLYSYQIIIVGIISLIAILVAFFYTL